ncbi:hypothetical protein AgCh_013661 [Apium graveolens]
MIFFIYDEDDLKDIINLLPNAIDLGTKKEILNMETQFEHFIQSSEAEAGNKKLSSCALNETPGSGHEVDLKKMLKSEPVVSGLHCNQQSIGGIQPSP